MTTGTINALYNQSLELLRAYNDSREYSVSLCAPLRTEDYVVQPATEVSPPKWHLGHTTWFFENFILEAFLPGYTVFDPDYGYIFNSYYETLGTRVIRNNRGNLSRPSVEEIMDYRAYVDKAMNTLLAAEELLTDELKSVLMLGINHEQQHQELLLTDIKYILGNNPLQPSYRKEPPAKEYAEKPVEWIIIEEGVYETGFEGRGFCFDNERERHKVYLNDFAIRARLVTNQQFLEFMEDDGYRDFRHWHAEGWEWINQNHIGSPLYWQKINGIWYYYTLNGLRLLDLNAPVCHISYFEAAAFAAWAGCRLPTEAEWETASGLIEWGDRWEWTESAYLPYPGYRKAPGAIGEYNGKFMINQMVLRGASEVTSPGHSRPTYRNFFHPHLRWQFSGIRLARSL